MCTATWLHDDDGGYRLFFNRDELRRRGPALPPEIHERDGVRFIAPTDGDAGGTWIAANAFGVTLCLLNGYARADSAEPASGWTSRGSLVVDLADSGSVEAVRARLADRALEPFRSFWLAALGPGEAGVIGKWVDGRLSLEPLTASAMPLTSSSFDTDAVRRNRIDRFANRVPAHPTVGDHLAYHASHDPEAGPYSVCMHRPDAHTVSFSCIAVDAERVHFRYVPHAPHEGLPHGIGAMLARRTPQ